MNINKNNQIGKFSTIECKTFEEVLNLSMEMIKTECLKKHSLPLTIGISKVEYDSTKGIKHLGEFTALFGHNNKFMLMTSCANITDSIIDS